MSIDHTVFFNTNMNLLKEHHPDIWRQMTDGPSKEIGEVILAPNGLPNIKLKKENGDTLFLHHKNDPTAEVPAFLKLLPEHSTSFVALFGMGLGYSPTAILEERPNIANLVIFEADKSIFLRALQHQDLSTLLTSPKVIISIGPECDMAKLLAPCFQAMMLEHIHSLRHLPSLSYHPEIYEKLKTSFFDYSSPLNINSNTMSRYGIKFIHNRFQNLSTLPHDSTLDDLKNIYTGTPAILVASGPSLNKNIHLLPKIKDKSIILCADSALPALKKIKISPDYITSLDPQNLTIEKFADFRGQLESSSLIASPCLAPKVANYLQIKKIFWTYNNSNMERWMNNLAGGKVSHGGGGTVAHLNLYAAIIMGCSPIILIGQDLALSDKESYANDVALTTNDFAQKLLKEKKEIIYTKSWSGEGTVPTRRNFMSYKEIFESVIKNNHSIYINATEGGAFIEGASHIPLHEAINKYIKENKKIIKTSKRPKKEISLRFKKTIKTLQQQFNQSNELQKRINKLNLLTQSIINDIKQITQTSRKPRNIQDIPPLLRNTISKMEQDDKKIDKYSVWPLLEEITLPAVQKNLRQQAKLKAIANDPTQYPTWLKGAITRIQDINLARGVALNVLINEINPVLTHCKKEKAILASLQKNPNNRNKKLELALLYMHNDNIRLARPILEDLAQEKQNSAEIFFQLGKVAAHQVELKKMDAFFTDSISIDPSYAEKINQTKTKIVDDYLKFATIYKKIDRSTYLKMLFKGFRYTEQNQKLNLEIKFAAQNELNNIFPLSEEAFSGESITQIQFWYDNIHKHTKLQHILNKETTSSIFYLHGESRKKERAPEDTIKDYTKAVEINIYNDVAYASMAKFYFSNAELEIGIENLNKAIEINPSHAKIWEELGDALYDLKHFNLAVDAYENNFKINPQCIWLLKKIGDCFFALGHQEAAKELYLEYKKTSKNNY